jgi:uncharacterized protein YvpB
MIGAVLLALAEFYLRQDLGVDETGGVVSKIPEVFSREEYNGISSTFSNNMQIRQLQAAIDSGGPAITTVSGHAIVVDSIKNGRVYIRDPYVPEPYSVSIIDFLRAWKKSGRQAVTFGGK